MGGHHNGNPASKVGFDKYRTAYKLGHSVVNFDDDDEETKHQNMPLRLMVGEYTAATHYDFLLLRVAPSLSCPCVDALHTRAVHFHRLLPSPNISQCLKPV